jgi:hypothetical protein
MISAAMSTDIVLIWPFAARFVHVRKIGYYFLSTTHCPKILNDCVTATLNREFLQFTFRTIVRQCTAVRGSGWVHLRPLDLRIS